MPTLFQNGQIFYQGRFQGLDLLVDPPLIRAIGPNLSSTDDRLELVDLAGRLIVPGFLDIHTHGGVGVDINSAQPADYPKLISFFARHGVTGFLASIVADSYQQTVRAIRAVRQAHQEMGGSGSLLGIHLEGPFLNSLFKGAISEAYLREGDLGLIQDYQALAGGLIRYITLAPECCPGQELIGQLVDIGIQVALGHSNADFDQAVRAIDQGARAITHIFNAMRPLHHRQLGIAGAGLVDDRVYTEVICDGLHLQDQAVRLVAQHKGKDRLITITDSMMATGLGDGVYRLAGNRVMVRDGEARLGSDGALAGSTLTMDRALTHLMSFAGYSLAEALPVATKNPADLLGLRDRGDLAIDKRADFLILKEDLNRVRIVATYSGGQRLYPEG